VLFARESLGTLLMSNWNSTHNRVVWFDIPVADLDRAIGFYAGVLGISVTKQEFGGMALGLLEHGDGNGGCLVENRSEIAPQGGILVYLNVNNRIRDAVEQVGRLGGSVVEPTHAIGPHGFRAIIKDSEGNRIALHSTTDA
jgi:predicted enzyme related to lactoylglutathione lyase